MFKNIGGKIKGLAMAGCWIGIIISFVYGLCIMFESYQPYNGNISTALLVYGLAIMVIGSFASWLGSLCTYGFGELVESASVIKEKLLNSDESDK